MREPQPDGYLTTSELAQRRCYPGANSLYNWRAQGKGPPFIKINGRVFYRLADLAAWEEGLVVRPEANDKT